MGKVKSLNEAREEKTLSEMRQFIDEVMCQADPEKALPDDVLDKKSEKIAEKWIQCKGGAKMEKLYTPEEVAEYLRVSEKTVRNFLRAKTLKGVKVGREWRIRERDLQDYVNGLNGTSEK